MKALYSVIRLLLPALFFVMFAPVVNAQTCPGSGAPGSTAFDTTISFPAGVISTEVKFPKFNPENGMVTCVRLCITIQGIIDTVALQNFTFSPQTGSYSYTRTDEITGPGIGTPLTSNANLNFGPFPLGPNDGVPNAGTDIYTKGSDTVLTRQLCMNINDSLSIEQFYGLDSVIYDYEVNANAVGLVTGGSSFALVLSSARVNFRFEYCTCPAGELPLNVRNFLVSKQGDNIAQLVWSGYDDVYSNYYYEAEVSRDGRNFTSIGIAQKNTGGELYKMMYTAPQGESGTYYFRIKQVHANGEVHYSIIKQVVMEKSGRTKFYLHPNPSTGIVGIKFDNTIDGQFDIQIFNTQGQLIAKKDLVRASSGYVQMETLKPGVYWVRVTERKSQESSVNQLLIK